MPLNDYKCSKCGEVFTDVLARTEHDAMVKIMWEKCPNQTEKGHANKSACPLSRNLSTANFGDSVRMGMVKPPSQFRERVEQIKKANPGHRINS